jgi:hypothetical protein
VKFSKEILAGIQQSADEQKRARAAYLAICLDMAPDLAKEHPAAWRIALVALNEYQPLVEYLFFGTAGDGGTLATQTAGGKRGRGFSQEIAACARRDVASSWYCDAGQKRRSM